MEFVGKFFDVVEKVYTFPLEQYVYGTDSGARDWPVTIMLGIIIYGLTAAILCVALYGTFRKISWYRHRQPCQHSECGHQWTTAVSDGSDPGCSAGGACCGDCLLRHEEDAVLRRANTEPRYDCPLGCGKMEKIIFESAILDHCRRCDGYWLSADERRQIETHFYKKGYGDGYNDRSSDNSAATTAAIAASTAATMTIINN